MAHRVYPGPRGPQGPPGPGGSGTPLSNVFYADQGTTPGGDGAIGTPFKTITAAYTATPAGGTIIGTPYDYSGEALLSLTKSATFRMLGGTSVLPPLTSGASPLTLEFFNTGFSYAGTAAGQIIAWNCQFGLANAALAADVFIRASSYVTGIAGAGLVQAIEALFAGAVSCQILAGYACQLNGNVTGTAGVQLINCGFGAPITITSPAISVDAGTYKQAIAAGVTFTTPPTLLDGSDGIENQSGVTGATVSDALDALEGAIPSVPVTSVFSRIGAVVATAGDYAASLVSNDSSVTGSTVKDALNALLTAIGGLVTGVSTVFGRAGAVVAVAGDYAASLVSNDSSVTGSTVKDALNVLPRVPIVQAYSNDESNLYRSQTDNTTSYTAINGSQFTEAVGASDWTFNASTCSYTYGGTNGKRFRITINQNVTAGNTGTFSSGVDVNGDVIGTAPGTSSIRGQQRVAIQTTGANGRVFVSSVRTVALNSGDVIKPAGGYTSTAGNVTLRQLQISIEESPG